MFVPGGSYHLLGYCSDWHTETLLLYLFDEACAAGHQVLSGKFLSDVTSDESCAFPKLGDGRMIPWVSYMRCSPLFGSIVPSSLLESFPH